VDAGTEALRLNPGDGTSHCNLGLVLLLQGRNTNAIGCFRRAIDLEPSDALEARVLLAALLWRLHPVASAELCKAALAKPGKDLSPFRRAELRALAHLMLNEPNVAAAELRSASSVRELGEMFQSAIYELFDNSSSQGVDKLLAVWAEIRSPP
jgi:Flp pilus assembly protein TadD